MRVSSTDPYFPAEMLEIYPQQIVRTGIQEIWQKKPCSLETCYTVPAGKNAAMTSITFSRRIALAREYGKYQVVTDSDRMESKIRRIPEKNRVPLHSAATGIQQDREVWHDDARAHVVAE